LTPAIRVLALYPDELNIYADRGNLLFLENRCSWRGIGFVADGIRAGETFDPDEIDLLYIGGGQDRDQEAVAGDLVDVKGEAVRAFVERGKPLLAVCGGYQLMGLEWDTGRGISPGLGIFPVRTVRGESERLIGPVAIQAEYAGRSLTVAGFENHAGRSHLEPGADPFGRVLAGHGNDGRDGTEGARVASAIGTYLHGPLLPKNFELADLLIAVALDPGSPNPGALPGLDDAIEELAHQEALDAAVRRRSNRSRRFPARNH
jgi:CobQ-like glutamine amidotransferase family enzyme